MSDFWIRCNVCGGKEVDSKPICLLTCRHLVCRGCLEQLSSGSPTCPVCNSAPVRYLQLGRDKIPPHIQCLFSHPGKALKQSFDASNFQFDQQKIALDRMARTISDQKKALDSMKRKYQDLEKIYEEQKREINQLESRLASRSGQPPPKHHRGYITSPPPSSSRLCLKGTSPIPQRLYGQQGAAVRRERSNTGFNVKPFNWFNSAKSPEYGVSF